MKEIILWMGAVCLALFLLAWLLARTLYVQMLTRRGVERTREKRKKKDTIEEEKRREARHRHKAHLLSFPHEEWERISGDGLRLKARFFPASAQSRHCLVFVHGYTSTGPNEFAVFCDLYKRRDFHILLVDNRAHGMSEGEAIGMGVLDSVDVAGWITTLLSRKGEGIQILLHGVSMGAATVMMLADKALPKQVRGIIADCGYTSVWAQFVYQMRKMYHLPPFPILYMAERICRKRAGYGFRGDSPQRAVKRSTLPILFIHGTMDDFVPTVMAQELYAACTGEKQLLLVPGARHAQSYARDAQGYENAVDEFLRRIEMDVKA